MEKLVIESVDLKFNNKKSILIVDDHSENIDILIGILGNEYRIRAITNGYYALEQIELEAPDLILLDIMMPDMSGFELCQLLKENAAFKSIPVIFITSLSDISNEEKGFSLGAVDYLYKPFRAALVRARVQNHLMLYMKRQDLEEMVRHRTQHLEKVKKSLIAAMAYTTEARDQSTGNHLFHTQQYVQLLAKDVTMKYGMKLSSEDIELMAISAMLHDIGKVGIPDSILLKKGRLTQEEFQKMKEHTLIGGEMLKKTRSHLCVETEGFLNFAWEIACYHHEYWDGSGYPYGLRGEQIPLSARIMCIVDVYDALRSKRPYKEASTHEEAVSIIRDGDGRTDPSHFDPIVYGTFLDMQDQVGKVQR